MSVHHHEHSHPGYAAHSHEHRFGWHGHPETATNEDRAWRAFFDAVEQGNDVGGVLDGLRRESRLLVERRLRTLVLAIGRDLERG